MTQLRATAGIKVHGHQRQPAPPGAHGYLAFRVTNTPYQTPYKLVPPFQQVLVQGSQTGARPGLQRVLRYCEEWYVANLHCQQ